MGKINLWVNRTIRDLEMEEKIPGLKPLIRIECEVLFSGKDVSETAIVDTGAHISLLPFQIWKDLDVDVIAEHHMSGVVPDKKVPVDVGYVKARLIDEKGNESKEIRFLSYLAFTNKVALLLGMRDLLERFDMHINFSGNEAYIEEI